MSRRAGLDRASVVREAAVLADAGGFDAVTIPRLAGCLGVRPPSLYNHITGIDGLRRDLAVHGAREMAARLGRAAIGKAGDDALIALANAYRAFAKERPGLYAATLRAPDFTDTELIAAANEIIGIVITVLAAYNLRDDDALHAVRALRSIVHGFVTLEAIGGFGLPLDLDETYARLLRTVAAGLRRGE